MISPEISRGGKQICRLGSWWIHSRYVIIHLSKPTGCTKPAVSPDVTLGLRGWWHVVIGLPAVTNGHSPEGPILGGGGRCVCVGAEVYGKYTFHSALL